MSSQITSLDSAASMENPVLAEQINHEIAIPINIPHDLAVQIVGSDAGKAKRMKPHSSMTKGATTAESSDVAEFMQPFLDREIDRVHNHNTRGIRGHVAEGNHPQALAIKRFCERFAASLRTHLEKHAGDDRLHRTRQRLDQAYDVIRQINAGLGQADADVRPFESVFNDLVIRLKPMRDELQQLKVSGKRILNRGDAPDGQVTAVTTLLGSIDQFLNGGAS